MKTRKIATIKLIAIASGLIILGGIITLVTLAVWSDSLSGKANEQAVLIILGLLLLYILGVIIWAVQRIKPLQPTQNQGG